MLHCNVMRQKRDEAWLRAIGARLEATRKALDVKHADMAAATKMSAARWSNYVNGRRPLDVERAKLLCDKYKLTLDWIYRGDLSGLPYALAEKLMTKESTVVPLPRRR